VHYQYNQIYLDHIGELAVLTKQLIGSGQLDAAFMLIGAFAASDVKEPALVQYIGNTYRMPLELLAANLTIEFSMPINEWAKSMIQVMDKLAIYEERSNY
jgi:hypothetical protein